MSSARKGLLSASMSKNYIEVLDDCSPPKTFDRCVTIVLTICCGPSGCEYVCVVSQLCRIRFMAEFASFVSALPSVVQNCF